MKGFRQSFRVGVRHSKSCVTSVRRRFLVSAVDAEDVGWYYGKDLLACRN